MDEETTPCTPQLVEITNQIPLTTTCGGTYRVETPLLISTWEPGSTTTTVTGLTSRCPGSTTSVDGTAVDISFGGGSGGSTCSSVYRHTFDIGVTDTGGPFSVIDTLDGAYRVTGTTIVNEDVPFCKRTAFAIVESWDGVALPNIGITEYTGSCTTLITSVTLLSSVKLNPSDPDCNDTITIKYEGCSTSPAGSYSAENPPPGGGTPGGTSSPSGNPPPPGADTPGTPPPPPGGFPGGGFLGGGNSGGSSPPPPPSPVQVSTPVVATATSQPIGDQIIYPDDTVLTPEPTGQFPPLYLVLPGGDIVLIPWSGYAFFPSGAVGDVIVFGNAYPSLYVSPQISQRAFHNWKVLKHVLLQFENTNIDVHTPLTTTDTLSYGKAIQRFNANVGIIFNDELSDQSILDLYRYDGTLWSNSLYSRHKSPKQLEPTVLFKEPLQGTSYSYQLVVSSMDDATWKLVGWQIEGKQKGKRRNHGRD